MRGGGGPNGQRMPGNRAGMNFGNMPLSGKVDKFENETVTMTTAFGSIKTSVSDETKIYTSESAERSVIKKGFYVLVKGTGSMEKVDASFIQILAEDYQQAQPPQGNRPDNGQPPNGQGPDRRSKQQNPANRPARDIKDRPLVGKVSAISSDKMVLEFGFGKTTIALTDDVKVSKTVPGTITDIKTGSQILLRGQGDPTSKMDAKSIYILNQ